MLQPRSLQHLEKKWLFSYEDWSSEDKTVQMLDANNNPCFIMTKNSTALAQSDSTPKLDIFKITSH